MVEVEAEEVEEVGMREAEGRRRDDLEAREGSCPAVEGLEGAQTVTGLLPRQDQGAGVEEVEQGLVHLEEGEEEVQEEEALILVPGRTLEVEEEEERPLHGPGTTAWDPPRSPRGPAMTALVPAPAGRPMTALRTLGSVPGRTTTLKLTVNR